MRSIFLEVQGVALPREFEGGVSPQKNAPMTDWAGSPRMKSHRRAAALARKCLTSLRLE